MSLHFSFDIGCTFCSLKASTEMHLFWIGTNSAAFRTLRLSSQVLDKTRVHRHPAFDSRLTWPKWSEPNMRSPPLRSRQESTCPPVKVSIYKLQLHPLLLFVSRTKIQSSGRHHRPQLFSWDLYSTRSAHMSISVMLYFHGSHLDSNVGSPSLHASFSADLDLRRRLAVVKVGCRGQIASKNSFCDDRGKYKNYEEGFSPGPQTHNVHRKKGHFHWDKIPR